MTSTPRYRGRFAPSPTGPLHMGSLVTALASWLDARSRNGTWLVRIEDIDPPRAVPGSDSLILKSLEAHGLTWDDEVIRQSQRQDRHLEVLDTLASAGYTYACRCSRADIQAMGGVYDGRCRNLALAPDRDVAIRFRADDSMSWVDLVRGPARFDCTELGGDFVVLRRDGLISYQLAVSVDDLEDGITHVIRGVDLYDSTARQLMVLKALNAQPPEYGHLPLIVDTEGQKLSKQSGAEGLQDDRALENLQLAVQLLGLDQSGLEHCDNIERYLAQLIQHWHLGKVPLDNQRLPKL